MGRSTNCCHQFVLDWQRWEEVRFVATRLCAIVKHGKKYDLLPSACARSSKMGRSTVCCHQLVLDFQRWEEVRFVAISLCSIVKDGKKVRFVATSLRLIVKDGKKYDLLPSACARLSKMGRSTICCHQFVLDCQRWEEVRFVATSLCSGIEVRFVATSLCSIVKRCKEVRFVAISCA